MLVIYPPNHTTHQPPSEIFNGQAEAHQEVPGRVENILAAVSRETIPVQAVSGEMPLDFLAEVHDQHYLRFLESYSASLGAYRYPSVFEYRAAARRDFLPAAVTNNLVLHGYYSFDMYTPVSGTTWQAARDSAACSYQAAELVANGTEKVTYALGRPPGHHAEFNQMGGYCYLNNCAVAAQYLSHHGRVATLDVDFHHGNGTQHIFYDRADVLTTSLHAHPDWKFPFFSGYEHEIGTGVGEGYNLNVALTEGTTDKQYQAALEPVLARIAGFNPAYLVVSLGLDTHQTDPIGGFALTTGYFTQMARSIAQLNLPTVIVQEGGYNTELLGDNAVAFLRGF